MPPFLRVAVKNARVCDGGVPEAFCLSLSAYSTGRVAAIASSWFAW